MSSTTKSYLQQASESLTQVKARITKGEILTLEEARMIPLLETAIVDLRNSIIIHSVCTGRAQIDVAKDFGISPARVSQLVKKANV